MEEDIREQLPNNVSMSDSVSQGFISMFNEMLLNLEDDGPLYHVFPKNLQNKDTKKSNMEAFVDDKMEKDDSSEIETCLTPVVTKEVEMTPFLQISFQK